MAARTVPPEILTDIFCCGLQPPGIQSFCDAPFSTFNVERDWREVADVLLACCQVSRNWSHVARDVLYKGMILVCTPQAIRSLLRTIQDNVDISSSVRHLALYDSSPVQSQDGTEFSELATNVLSVCNGIWYLECRGVCYSRLADVMPSAEFEYLREIGLNKGTLANMVPLLTRAPNLKKLELSEIEPQYHDNTAPDLPCPTFRLKKLIISASKLSQAQCLWLLNNSRRVLVHVVLEHLTETMLPRLAAIVGPSVRTLEMAEDIRHDDTAFAREIVRFPHLIELKLYRFYSPPRKPFPPLLAASLERIEFSYPAWNVEHFADRLKRRTWLPNLKEVVVDDQFRIGVTENVADKNAMENACEERRIQLTWSTQRSYFWRDPAGGTIDILRVLATSIPEK